MRGSPQSWKWREYVAGSPPTVANRNSSAFKTERERQVQLARVLNAGRDRLKVLYASGT